MKFRSRLLVNLDHFASNVSHIKEIVGNRNILYMVKADGYGHGMCAMARFAYHELNIKNFGCATINEAILLKQELPGHDYQIYIFSDIQLELAENIDVYFQLKFIPVISNLADLQFILNLKVLPLCLKFNTGMNRLGIHFNDIEKVISLMKAHNRFEIFHLMSHYANSSSDIYQHAINKFQTENYLTMIKELTAAGISILHRSSANSGAIEQLDFSSSNFNSHSQDDFVRPGLMMYGVSSLNDGVKGHFKGRLVSKLETYVIRTFNVKKGDIIGYGSTPCPHPGQISILAIGYGDGFSTRYTGASLNHGGKKGMIFGRINMDMTQVLFENEAVKPQEIISIWGQNPDDLELFSRETKTIPYELFCALLPRIPRVYTCKI